MRSIPQERIVLLLILLAIGLVMAGVGSYVMNAQHTVRQESQLLQNYNMLLQSSSGKNMSLSNLTYVIGSTGQVVSFNDIMTNTGVRQKPATINSGIT